MTDYEQEMWAAAAEVAEARRLIDEAEQRLAAARDSADLSIRRYGAFLALEDEQVSQDTLAALYWQHPDIRAKTIAEAFGIRGGASMVHKLTGTNGGAVPCAEGCGNTLRIESRTGGSYRRTCPECSARFRAQNAESAATRERRGPSAFELETRTWIRERIAAGDSLAAIMRDYDPEDTSSMSRGQVSEWLIDEASQR